MAEFFNTREWAIGIWMAITTAVAFVFYTRNAISVVRAALAPPLLVSGAVFLGYLVFAVFVFMRVGLWDWPQLKTTLLWLVFTAPGMLVLMITSHKQPKFVSTWVRDSLGAAVFVELIVNTYTFALWVELILVPVFAFLALMLAFSAREERTRSVASLISFVFGVFGLYLIGRGVWMIVSNWTSFATLAALQDFYTAPLMSLSVIPFLYGFYLYARYETAFQGLQFAIPNKALRDYARAMAIITFNVRTHLIQRWRKQIARVRPETRADVVEALTIVLRGAAREHDPQRVDAAKGWCPIAAGKFLADLGYASDDYHRSYDDAWFAQAPMRRISTAFPEHNMAFYIEGDEEAAHELRLRLYINSAAQRDGARATFVRVGEALLERALPAGESDAAKKLFSRLTPFATNGSTRVALKREEFDNVDRGYQLTLELTRYPQEAADASVAKPAA